MSSIRNSRIFLGGILLFVSFAVFSPSLDYDFVNWDDHIRIVKNPTIRSLAPENIIEMFSSYCISNYTPIERLSCALDYAIWGMNPWGFRFTNIFLHSLNTCLIFILALRIFDLISNTKNKFEAPAFFSALIFALHPLRVESVVWISERRDVLSLFWLLLSLLCYFRYATTRQMSLYLGTWFLFILSLLSKATAVTIPVVLLLIDFYPLKRFALETRDAKKILQCMLEKIPFFAASLIIGLIAVYGQAQSGAMAGLDAYSWSVRIANTFTGLTFYIQKFIFPWSLYPLYPSPPHAVSWTSFPVILSVLLILLISILSIQVLKKNPSFSVSWWSFLVMILPFTGLLQSGNAAAADRYTYMAMIPIALLLGYGATGIRQNFSVNSVNSVFLTLLLGIYSVLTIKQSTIWKNSITLWEYAMRETPHEFSPLYNYSNALIQNRNYHLARVLSAEVVQLKPHWSAGWHNYGVAQSLTGHSKEAISSFRRALQVKPSGDTHFALANLLFLENKVIEARRHYFLALQDGVTGERLVNLAITINDSGHPQMAIKYLAEAVLLKEPRAYSTWALILAKHSQIEAAKNLLRLGYQNTNDSELLKEYDRLNSNVPKTK